VVIARQSWQSDPEARAVTAAAGDPAAITVVSTPLTGEGRAPPVEPPPALGEPPAVVTSPAPAPVAAKKPSGPTAPAPASALAAGPAPIVPSSAAPTARPNTPDKAAQEAAGPAASVGVASTDGYLSLDSAPWAEVYLGNQLLGNTPLLRVALPPGKHELTLKNPELQRSTTYVVEVQAGGNLSRFVGWEQEGR
jgi:serine/threonine-protein kinase